MCSVARRVANDLVVNVGDVHYVSELMTTLAEETAKKIDYQEGAEVANMSVIVDGGPARVHSNKIVGSGRKLLNFAGQRVVEVDRQTVILAKRSSQHSAFSPERIW